MLEALSKKQKIIFFIILSIMLVVIIYYIYSAFYKNTFTSYYETNNLIEDSLIVGNNTNILENSENDYIIIYICGAVKENKVITLKQNSRISDAIDAVGGLNTDADLTNINLAYILEDGEKIYIPKIGEQTQEDTTDFSSVQNNLDTSYYSNSKNNKKVNINKATQTELETIPGIGPSTASKIIDYREENGRFYSIEDIKNVDGIGDKKYENIKDYISLK